MATYVYRPDCYLANERGMVEKNDDYFQWLYLTENNDKRMMIGNKYVEFRFNTDTMRPTKHPMDGKIYESKKRFRNETRAHGCVEVGDQTHYLTKKRTRTKADVNKEKAQRRHDIKRAVWELRNGRDIKTEVKEAYHKSRNDFHS